MTIVFQRFLLFLSGAIVGAVKTLETLMDTRFQF